MDLKEHLANYIALLYSGQMKEAETYLNSAGLSGKDKNAIRVEAFIADDSAKQAAFNYAAGTVGGGTGKLPRGLSETGRRLTPTQLAKLRKAPSGATNAAEEFLRKNLGSTLKESRGGAETFIRGNLGLGQGAIKPRPFGGNVDLSKLKNVGGAAEDAFRGITSRSINLPGRLPSFGKKTIAAGAAAAGGGIYSLLNRDGKKSNVRNYADLSPEEQAANDEALSLLSGFGEAFNTINSDAQRKIAQGAKRSALSDLQQKYIDLGFDEETALEAAQEDLLRQLSGGGGDGSGVGYAQIGEQRRQFDIEQQRLAKEFEEESAQFTRQDGRLSSQYTMDLMRGAEEFEKNYGLQMQQLGLSREEFEQAKTQFSQQFAENQRQFNTQEGRLSKSLDLEAELGRGGLQENIRSNKAQEQNQERQRALAEQQYIGQILSRPSDFLARAFSMRGETSPYATVTQADLINNLKAGVSGATKGFAKGGATTEGKFVTGEQGKEAILNPTNAPIIVLNNDQTRQMGNLPGYQGGTLNNTGYDPNLVGGQTGTFSTGGSYYTNPDGTSGATGSPSDQFLYLQNILGQSSDMAARGAGFGNAGDAIRSVDPGYLTAAEAQQTAGTFSGQSGISQQSLRDLALSSAPPGAKNALYGGKIGAARPAGQLTLGRLGRLTGSELQALNTLLAATENSDLETELGLLQQRFGPVVNRSRGRLQV